MLGCYNKQNLSLEAAWDKQRPHCSGRSWDMKMAFFHSVSKPFISPSSSRLYHLTHPLCSGALEPAGPRRSSTVCLQPPGTRYNR